MSSPRVRLTIVSTCESSSSFWNARMSSSVERSKRVPGNGLNGIRLTFAASFICTALSNWRIRRASSRACTGWSLTPFIMVYSNVIELRGLRCTYRWHAAISSAIGYFLLSGTSSVRNSSLAACSDTASDTSLSWLSRSIIGTMPAVDRVTRLLARP